MNTNPAIGILYDRIRWEEKEIARQLEGRGASAVMIDAKLQVFDLGELSAPFPSVVLERCVSFFRGINAASVLEEQGVKMINSCKVLGQCGNKLTTSLLLSKSGVPTPKTVVAFSAESAIEAVERIGYPCVLKPIIGSWGRQVICVRDKVTAEALIDLREQTNDSMQSIFYVQEMVDRPARDVRCITVGEEIVASVYRYAPPNSWKTNVAIGGHTETCPVSSELEQLVLRASRSVGGGALGVDVMERKSDGELLVHEINGTVEFKGAQAVTQQNIAGEIVDYAIKMSKDTSSIAAGYKTIENKAQG